MRNQPISFGSQSYQSPSLPWSAQRLVNWYAESAPPSGDTLSPLILLPRPGTEELQAISGECRALYVVNDILYGVFGNAVYSIDTDYTATLLGNVGISGPVYITDNGDQLNIVTDPSSYIYNFSSGVFSQVTDIDFLGASSVTHLDGYFVYSRSGNSGEFFFSDSLDGTSFDALNFATAEMDSDVLLRVFADHGELWLFGSKTTEIWIPAGTTDFPFTRSTNAGPEKGISAPDSVAKVDNTICWIGHDRVVYRSNGYTPVVISTRPIEKILTTSTNLSEVTGRAYTQNGHAFYILTSAYNGWTLVYDAATGLWHERATYPHQWWRYGHPVYFNNEVIVGGVDGNLYALNTTTYTEDTGTIRFEVTSPPVSSNGQRITVTKLEVLMETGVGLTAGQGSDPQAMLQFSKDGGRTWSSEQWRTMGAIGEYNTRVVWRNLGQGYNFVFRLAVSDPVKPVIMAAYLDADVTL